MRKMKKSKSFVVLVGFSLMLVILTGCIPPAYTWKDNAATSGTIFVTSGTVNRDHEVIKAIQITKGGFWLWGVVPVITADLKDAFKVLEEEAEKAGADAVINVTFDRTAPSYPFFLLGYLFAWVTPEAYEVRGLLIKYN